MRKLLVAYRVDKRLLYYYIARVTGPDIAYSVNKVAAHAFDPSKTHCVAVNNIIRYIAATFQRDSYIAAMSKQFQWAYTPMLIKRTKRRIGNPFMVSLLKYLAARFLSRPKDNGSYLSRQQSPSISLPMKVWRKQCGRKFFWNASWRLRASLVIPPMIDNKSTIKRLTNRKIRILWIPNSFQFAKQSRADFYS